MKTIFKLTRLPLLTLAAAILVPVAMPSAVQAAERTFAGVRTFSPIGGVLRKYGDPTFIASGTQVATIFYGPGKPSLFAPGPDNGPTPANSDMASPGGQGSSSQYGGQSSQYGSSMSRMGSMSPMGSMSSQYGGMGGASGAAGLEDPFDPLYDHASRYYYDDAKLGNILEFVATGTGKVVEIKAYGYHGPFKTSEGIGLGATYAQVVLKYGYPEKTINVEGQMGDELTLIYAESAHVSFKLVRNRVAAISVVAPD
jgi:hypothetical protein